MSSLVFRITFGLLDCIFLIPSSHRRRIDGELNWQAKRWQSTPKPNESVKTVIEHEKALSNLGYSARVPKNFKLFNNNNNNNNKMFN